MSSWIILLFLFPFFPPFFPPMKVFVLRLSITFLPSAKPATRDNGYKHRWITTTSCVHASLCWCVDTYSAGSEFGWVVVHIGHRNDRCCCVWETIVEVSFHICGLNNDYVLLNFLEKKRWESKMHPVKCLGLFSICKCNVKADTGKLIRFKTLVKRQIKFFVMFLKVFFTWIGGYHLFYGTIKIL